MSASLNITITELILTRCKNLPVRDRNVKRNTYKAMIFLFIRRVNAFTPGLGAAPLYEKSAV